MNILELVFDWLLAASLRASIVALCILVIQGVLRGSLPARWRYALWLPMVLVLLLPLLPTRPWSFGLVAIKSEVKTENSDQANVRRAASLVTMPVVRPEQAPAAMPWKKIALRVWLAGACGGWMLTWHAYRRTLARHTVKSAEINPGMRAMIAAEAALLRLWQAPEVRLVSASHSPAVAGLLRPMLLLPADFPLGFTNGEARLIIRHELMHLRRHDLAVNWLLCGLQCLHWFNPLLWLAFSRMRADRELACDAAVLTVGESDQRAEYGHALLKLQHVGPLPASSLALVGIFGRGSSIRGRITRIAGFRPASRAWNFGAGLLVAVVTFLAVTRPQPLDAADRENAPPHVRLSSKFIESARDLAKHGQVLEDAEVQDIVRTASQASGVDILSAPTLTAKIGQRGIVEVTAKDQSPSLRDGNPLFLGNRLELQTKLIKGAFRLTAIATMGRLPHMKATESLNLEHVDWQQVRMSNAKATAALKPGQHLAVILGESTPGRHVTVFIRAESLDPATGKPIASFLSEVTKKKSVNVQMLGASEAPPRAATEWNQKKLDQIILPRVQFRSASISEVVEFLRAKSRAEDKTQSDPKLKGVNILIKPGVGGKLSAALISLDLTQVPLGEALRYAAELAGYKVNVRPAWVELTPKSDTPAPDPASRPKVMPVPAEGLEVEKKIKRIVLPKVIFRDVTLEEAVEFLRVKSREFDTEESDPKSKGVNIVMDISKIDRTTKITLDLISVPLYEALLYTASLANLKMSIAAAGVQLAP